MNDHKRRVPYRAIDTQKLFDFIAHDFKTEEEGPRLISYDTLSELIGRDVVIGGGRQCLDLARLRMEEEFQVHYRRQTGLGIIRNTDEENAKIGIAVGRKIKAIASNAARRIAFSDREKLDAATKLIRDVGLTTTMIMVDVTSENGGNRIKEAVKTKGQPLGFTDMVRQLRT